MKYFLTTILICFSLFSYGQFSWGAKAGLNINDIEIKGLPKGLKDNSSISLGFHIGAYGKLQISEKFSFIPELQFSQRGVKDDTDVKINLNYIELPVLISYSIAKWCSIDLGPNIGFKISAVAKGDGSKRNIDTFYNNDLDLGLSAGLRVPLLDRLSLIGRYYVGLTSISELSFTDVNGESTTVKEYNRTGQFGISYQFN